jgi:tetratricopeptide (TPR) repeat protein
MANVDRLAGLPSAAAEAVRGAYACLQRNALARAGRLLARASAVAPEHPEILRLAGLRFTLARQPQAAVALFERSLERRPDDPPTLNELAGAHRDLGEHEAAFAAWRRACAIDPTFLAPLLNLGRNLKLAGRGEECLAPLQQALALAPDHRVAREMHADALMALGRLDAAAAEFHEILRREPANGAAWWGLAKIKTRPLMDAELEQLAVLSARDDLPTRERMPMAFALGKALEDRGRHDQAFTAFSDGNAMARRRHPWDPAAFTQRVDAILDPAHRPRSQAPAGLGGEIVFLVSLPRAGSTLVEQILAAHPDVEGAGELTDLPGILQQESIRRQREFPLWVADADAEDWERMGRLYLEHTRRWRAHRPRCTDKLPGNWLFTGTIGAMLPGAHVVICDRDPVENAWSCYKELFVRGGEFTYDFAGLAAFRRDFDRCVGSWQRQADTPLHRLRHEALLDDFEGEIRALLAYCGLGFAPECLRFHEVERAVHTASAAQVRAPLRRDTARAAAYGHLLDPLRRALAPEAPLPMGEGRA